MSKSDAVVQSGDRVTISFDCRLDDGRQVMSSNDGDHYEFTVGADEIFPKVNDASLKMKIGEKKTIDLDADDAFGPVDETLVKEIDATDLPPDVDVGDIVTVESSGHEIDCVVREKDEKTAVIDANHPLAGIKLVFEFEIKDIVKGSH